MGSGFRRFAKLIAVLLLVMIVAAVGVYTLSEIKIGRDYQSVAMPPVAVPSDAASVIEGKRLAATRGCVDCHGEDMGGKLLIDDPAIGKVQGANLTAGRGGVLRAYDDAALGRAIRNGIGQDGRALLIMPSLEYFPMSDTDLGRIIAYIRAVPAVDRDRVPVSLGPLGRVLITIDDMELAANVIDHDAAPPPPPPVGATVAYGQYLAAGCTGCHGNDFSGGRIPGGPPEWPVAMNITPHMDSGIGKWTGADFDKAMRTGKRPDGAILHPLMPWRYFVQMTDLEIEALWRYFRTVPAKEAGNR